MCFGLIGSAETTFCNEGLDQKSQLEVVRANLENQSISANHLLFPTCVPGGVIPCIQWQLVLGHATNHKTTVQKIIVDVARSQRSLSNFPPQRRSLNKCSPPYLIWFKSTFHLGVNFTDRCAKSSEISVTLPPVFCLKFFDTKQPQTHLSENFFRSWKCPHAHIWCFCSCHVLKEPFHRDCVTFQWPLVKSKFPVKKFRLCYSGERTQEHAPGLISMCFTSIKRPSVWLYMLQRATADKMTSCVSMSAYSECPRCVHCSPRRPRQTVSGHLSGA